MAKMKAIRQQNKLTKCITTKIKFAFGHLISTKKLPIDSVYWFLIDEMIFSSFFFFAKKTMQLRHTHI